MTRRGYVAMAQTIRRHVEMAPPHGRDYIAHVVRDLCHDLKCDNRNFDRDRFLDACGLAC